MISFSFVNLGDNGLLDFYLFNLLKEIPLFIIFWAQKEEIIRMPISELHVCLCLKSRHIVHNDYLNSMKSMLFLTYSLHCTYLVTFTKLR